LEETPIDFGVRKPLSKFFARIHSRKYAPPVINGRRPVARFAFLLGRSTTVTPRVLSFGRGRSSFIYRSNGMVVGGGKGFRVESFNTIRTEKKPPRSNPSDT